MNEFQQDLAGTTGRTLAERHVEAIRQHGGIFVDAVRLTRMSMMVTDATLPGRQLGRADWLHPRSRFLIGPFYATDRPGGDIVVARPASRVSAGNAKNGPTVIIEVHCRLTFSMPDHMEGCC